MRGRKPTLGYKLRQFREAMGMTQAELATKLDLHQAALSRIEMDKQVLSAFELFKASKVLGVSLNDFFRRSA